MLRLLKVNNFTILKNEVIKSASKDNIVLFDMDNALIFPTDEFSFAVKSEKS